MGFRFDAGGIKGPRDQGAEGRAVERIVLGAWYEQGSYLQREAGRYRLQVLD